MVQLREVVQAPLARPPKYGLLPAAPFINDPDMRWTGGWTFLPEGCGLGGSNPWNCAGDTAAMVPPAGPHTVEGDPIWVWAADACSSFGFAARDWQGRAQRQLAATESYQIAREFWDGANTIISGGPTRYLAGPNAESDTLTTAPATPLDAIGDISAGLAFYLKGQQGMIHCTPQMLDHLATNNIIKQVGNLWVSSMGHIVVADAGYSGSGPDNTPASTSQWIYGTPMIQIRLGPVDVIPETLDGAKQLARAFKFTTNDVAVFAGRLAGYQWAAECAHVAAEVNIAIATVGGA